MKIKSLPQNVFIAPAKTSPVARDGLPVQAIRTNVSVAALTIIGALEAAGYDVVFIDVSAEAPTQRWMAGEELVAAGLTDEEVVERVANARPRFVLISSMFTFEQVVVDRLIAVLRCRLPGTIIIVGGAHATVCPTWHLDNADFSPDVVVLGEGEETIVDLIQTLLAPEPKLESVAGIAFRNSAGQIIFTTPRLVPTRLDGPWALDTVLRCSDGNIRYWERWSRKSPIYISESIGADVPTFIFVASRGCPYGCSYCTSTSRHGHRIRHIGADLMFERFLTLRQRFGVAAFCNQADTFGFHPEDRRFLALVAEHRKKTDVNFVFNNPNAFFLREFFKKDGTVDQSIIELLHSAGFNVITLAIETLAQRFNEKIDWSQLSPSHVSELCRSIRLAGMRSELYMMYGFPGQTPDEFSKDMAFAKTILDVADSVSWHRTSILPGTKYYQELIVSTGREAEYRMSVRRGCSCCDQGSLTSLAYPSTLVNASVMEAEVRHFERAWV